MSIVAETFCLNIMGHCEPIMISQMVQEINSLKTSSLLGFSKETRGGKIDVVQV